MGRKIEISFNVGDPMNRSAEEHAYKVLPRVGDLDPEHARMTERVQDILDLFFDRSGNGSIVIDLDNGTATVVRRS